MGLARFAKALKGTVNGKWINVRGPGHGSHDRSLGIKFDPNAAGGFIVRSFAGDDPIVCRNYVGALLLQRTADGMSIDIRLGEDEEASRPNRIVRALQMWREAQPAMGTMVESDLAARRCNLAALGNEADSLRYHPFCPFGADRVPAMVALMTDVISREPRGVHRTALKDNGLGKRIMPDGMPPKMMLGRAKGAVVMLGRSNSRMGIAEGIETALSAQKIFEMPVWACLSTGGIAGFPIISGLKHLTIFADHDKAGVRAAVDCARRYQKNGIEVDLRHPTSPGDDWNSYLLREAA